MSKPKYPGKRVTTNGNQLVAKTEARISDCGVFYPITPSTEQGENFEMSVAQGTQTVFGDQVKAIEAEGEHAAQGGSIAMSVTGKRVSNFTSGQGIAYGIEQYYHAPGKLSTMVLNVGARALTKHALNVHCGHDDIMGALDTGWTMLMAKDAQQAVDQTLILRRVTEQSLTPGMNIQDGFLTTHLERTFLELESELIREYLGHPSDMIDTPTDAQKELFGEKRRRVPQMYDLKNPILLGSVQNQEHYMTGVIARRTHFNDHILEMLENAYEEFSKLTGRHYGLLSQYNCENADTVFFSLGSSAENIEAAVDYIKEKHGDNIGVMHLNVIRPFPERAIVEALKGKKNVIILERTDEPSAGSNPLARDVRTALHKALENNRLDCHADFPCLSEAEMPRIYEGVYGLGSRDFRPEHILGAYEYVSGKIKRRDGKKASDGERFFYLGVNHPYAVISEDTPSLLPESAIAVRIHSIGGWGAITTGKNMAEILGNLSNVSKFHSDDNKEPVLHISANPKYGSEKKGAPTNYFLVVARERVRVNCDLKHVDVVLCCDPKIFTHTDPMKGLKPGGAFIWEANIPPNEVWERIPPKVRQEMVANNIQLYTLNGFEIARANTKVESLQTRMQGNSFLGAFFAVSSFLSEHGIDHDTFLDTVHKQYQKKFGRFGDHVVASNMEVMKEGFEHTKKIDYGEMDALDNSELTGNLIMPQSCSFETTVDGGSMCSHTAPIFRAETYNEQFRTGDTYNQEASPLTATGIIAAGSGATNSKFVSRIKTPVYDPYKCTQCMACINVCPDTALPNTSQNIDTVLKRVFSQYVTNTKESESLLKVADDITAVVREQMNSALAEKNVVPFNEIVFEQVEKQGVSSETLTEIKSIMHTLPLGYGKTRSVFQMMEKKNEGEGGLFFIFVSDLCKGCAECVDACGDHEALKMVEEDADLRGEHMTAMEFFKGLPRTPKKFLGLFDPENIEEARAAILHNHLMVQDYYNAFASGDGMGLT